MPAVARAPLTNERLRPAAVTSRLMSTSAPAASSNSASMVAASVPVLTRSADARPPRRRPTASTRIDFPAPVSPVSAVNPGSSSTSTASITARLRMRSVRSMWAETPSYHTFDSIFSACYPALSALSQRRTFGFLGGAIEYARHPAACTAVARGRCTCTWEYIGARPRDAHWPGEHVRAGCARDPLGRLVGDHPAQILGLSRRGAAYTRVSRRFPQEQQVLRGSGGLHH